MNNLFEECITCKYVKYCNGCKIRNEDIKSESISDQKMFCKTMKKFLKIIFKIRTKNSMISKAVKE